MHIALFVVLFLFAMYPTYVIRYAAIGAVFDHDGPIGDAVSVVGSSADILLIMCYIVMAVIAFLRGRSNNRKWIAAFPVIAAVFDTVLVFVPFVPTVMMILTIVFGCLPKAASEPVGDNSKA